jgi:bifunctional ADP-heptose synthase (sugar kinase/adenylyltransferase)
MTTAEIISKIGSLRVLVAGDLVLNQLLRHRPVSSRVSSEAVIPHVLVTSTTLSLGGSGAVVQHLSALRVGRMSLLGLIGGDGAGYELERALSSLRVSGELLLRAREMATPVCTRFLHEGTGREDFAQIDSIGPSAQAAGVQNGLVRLVRGLGARLEREAGEYDLILLSDGAENSRGFIRCELADTLAGIAAARPELLVWVDSPRTPQEFRGVVVKLNRRQADSASRQWLGRLDYLELRRATGAKLLFITCGPEGTILADETSMRAVPGWPVQQPQDSDAAPASFSAAAALALKISGDPLVAARLGNLAASIAIAMPRPGTASREGLSAADVSVAGMTATGVTK